MEDPTRYYPPPPSKLSILVYETKQTMAFAYGFMASFVICILLIFLTDPYGQSSSSSSSSSPYWFFFPNSSQSFPTPPQNTSSLLGLLPNVTQQPRKSIALGDLPSVNDTVVVMMNQTAKGQISESSSMGIGEEIGGLRDEQNITSTNSNGSDDQLYEHIESMLECDLFDGKWVKDDSYPLYAHGSCPYVDENFNCFLNGRPDSGYESYRWQPKHCNIPRLKGKDILEVIRGKRLVFVGDSLNRNMYESLVCVLENSVEDQSRVVRNYARHEFKDYNCSVEFLWSPFLVQESETPNRDGSKTNKLRLDVLDRSIDIYKDADILIFNSGHWYTESKTLNGRNYYQQGSSVYGKLDVFRAYRRGMITWGKWVEANVNPSNTQVFFRGNSATHFGGGKWNTGGRCDGETEPIEKEKYLSDYPEKMKILESVMKRMKTPVHYLNITRLTSYRKDAHPAAYRKLGISEEDMKNPIRSQDCTHWCLPGVPDIWNQILYAQLLINHYKKHKQKTTTRGY